MTDAPTVSVVVVSNARPDSLAVTLKSLEYQRFAAFEVIVVSDLGVGERPDSPLAIRWIDYAERNISHARNLGIAAARGSIVAFCDDDAVPEFGWLDHLTEPFAEPAVGAAGGYVRGRNGVSFQSRCVMVDRTGRDRHFTLPDTRAKVFAPVKAAVPKTVGTNCAIRRSALVAVGGFDAAYRFYLDEADLNRRLADAGWSTAIVPLAEVHHGFAAGPLRTGRRVPTALYEIGASHAYFLTRHGVPADTAPSIDAFRREQQNRLMRHFLLAQIDSRTMRTRLDELDAGLTDGADRQPEMALIPPAAAPFATVPPRASGQRRWFVTGPLSAAKTRRAAAAAAKAGDEVTVFAIEPSHRPLTVRFDPAGFFHHRIGLLGKDERQAKRRIARPRNRIAAECARTALQRGLTGLVPERAK